MSAYLNSTTPPRETAYQRYKCVRQYIKCQDFDLAHHFFKTSVLWHHVANGCIPHALKRLHWSGRVITVHRDWSLTCSATFELVNSNSGRLG